jgi:hypothetical protein
LPSQSLRFVLAYALKNVLGQGVPNSKDKLLIFPLGVFFAVHRNKCTMIQDCTFLCLLYSCIKIDAMTSSQIAGGCFSKLAFYNMWFDILTAVKMLMVVFWLWCCVVLEVATNIGRNMVPLSSALMVVKCWYPPPSPHSTTAEKTNINSCFLQACPY